MGSRPPLPASRPPSGFTMELLLNLDLPNAQVLSDQGPPLQTRPCSKPSSRPHSTQSLSQLHTWDTNLTPAQTTHLLIQNPFTQNIHSFIQKHGELTTCQGLSRVWKTQW